MARLRRISFRLTILLTGLLLAGTVGAGVPLILKRASGVTEQVGSAQRIQPAKPRPSTNVGTTKPSPDPVVVAAGDIACDPRGRTFNSGLGTTNTCRQAYTAELVERLRPAGVLVLGDIQYEDGRYRKYMRSYKRSWGRFKRVSHPTPGDADDRFGGDGYQRYWGARAGAAAAPWYSFDIGDWHIISLTSNCGHVGGCDVGSPQERWLRADLVAHPASCTLAFWHEPRFSSTTLGAPEMQTIWHVLYDFDVELVLSADAHNYERFRPQDSRGQLDVRHGVRQFIVGTGGKSLAPFTRRSPGSRARNSSTFGVLKLTLHPKSYDWRFVPESWSLFRDAGSASCH